MKKYYINDKGFLLVDENNTPYLIQNGYKEISKNEYDAIIEKQEEEQRKIEEELFLKERGVTTNNE